MTKVHLLTRDMEDAAAESRPLIANWLATGLLGLSCLIVAGACLVLVATVRHMMGDARVVGVSPSGTTYDLAQFATTKAAQSAAAKR